MANEQLTQFEKASFLGIKDVCYPDNYDREFYDFLWAQKVPDLLQIEDKLRPAIARFIREYWGELQPVLSGLNLSQDTLVESAMICAFLKGYELGRTRGRPLAINNANEARG